MKWLICFVTVILVVYTFEVNKEGRANKICSLYGYDVVEGRFGKEKHLLCLNPTNSSGEYSLKGVMMAYGFPVEDPSSGSAEGYIGDDNQFYGVLHLVFGLFDNDDIQAPSTPPRQWAPFSFPHFSYNYEYSPFTPGIPTSRICDLLLLADKEFYDKEGNSSLNQVYILVLTSNETNTRVFGDLGRENSVDGRSYLMKFSRLRRLSEVCLGHSFGAHHDDGSPNPECRGFLMGSQSSTSESTKHFEFSTCSKRLIAETLKSMRSSCLAEVDEAFCGNVLICHSTGERIFKIGYGGVLGAQRMCGPCCRVRDARTMTCVGAEFAAHVALSTNSLPDDWPYDDYRGPNVTLKLCNTKKCVKKTIRAWPSGGVCVLHNRVGMCDRGICRSVQMLPYFHLPSISMNPYSSLRSGATEIKMHWIYFMAILIAMKQI
ncbi:unnamed protein product [Leptidea sinapis]|uniref:Peptidase M12B domain-containing protein n=1 Tax=Leptidea sinapis TaxID=189913 RepID=A0A5E4QQY5_9NEOP|nr:unnamed protein product [Leptidea sinapis]